MKKKVFSLMMTLLLAFVGIARADELTVNDGAATNGFVPVYGFYADSYLKCEFVQPAADLAAMNGGTINGMTFYASQSSVSWGSANFQVFLSEVADATISAFYGPGTIVYEGALSIVDGLMTVNFTTPYTYNGGNLLVGVYNTVTGGYVTSTWYGETVDGSSVQGYSYSSLSDVQASQRNFLPKTTFNYIAGGGGGGTGAPYEAQIGEGTTTTGYFPFYTLYNYSIAENLFLASELTEAGVQPGQVTSLSWYATNTTGYEQQGISIWMANVSDTELTASSHVTTGMTLVYTGTSTPVIGWNEFPCNAGTFTWDGTSNVLIFCQRNNGDWNSTINWQAGTVDFVAMAYRYQDTGAYDVTVSNTMYTSTTRSNIIIKGVAAGGGGGGNVSPIFAMQDGERVDTVFVSPRPNGAWMEPFTFQMKNEGPAITVTNLDWAPQEYFTLIAPELPLAMAHGEEVDVQLTTGESENTDWQMVAIYGDNRTAAVWNIHVEPYDPAIPDVWEMAYDLGTVSSNFSYAGIPSQITPTELYNNYTLPFPEIEDGEDAVYKFTVTQDMILNAYVDEDAENGKVALYTEDFYGQPGPMADNNYTGLNLNGGSGGSGGGGASFQAQIGDGTTTLTYFPFHTLWNYSLAENLFLASELSAAGVTTAPMTSLSWYVSSTSCTSPQNGISIWMANVSDEALTSTSHTTAGMTLVYTGDNVLPVAGQWNEFEFNGGNFAWDGHSNILILCQRNNGDWQGSISWQTHNPGFAGTSYAYTDDAPGYDATTSTYSMSTSSTNRANIIFKGGNRNREDMTFGFEGGMQGWTSIDNDGDGNGWFHSSLSQTYSCYDYTGWGNDGSDGFAVSQTYTDCTYDSYDADNYLVSPQKYTLGTGASLNFFFDYANDSYPDFFEVCVATANNPTANDFTTVWDVDMRSNAAKTQIRHYNNRNYNWREVTVDLSAYAGQEVWIAFHHQDYDMYELFIDDITVNTGAGSTPTPGPTPTPGAGLEVSAGPVIENLGLTAGTYYLVASATQADYMVYINVDNMPCPAVEEFAFNEFPADNANEVEPASVTLQWMNPQYATAWRLVFGTTYYPNPDHDQTIMTDWSTNMATSYTVTNLYNNTNYFWHIEYMNDACPEGVSSPVWGFTTHLNIPTNLTAEDYTIFNDEQVVLHWNAVADRTYRMYFIYRDGVKIGETQMNNINATTYTDGPLAYNMGGYTYYVTAIYDEGESAPSDPVNVKVSGYGDVNGHVYEMDGTTGIANATVTMVGQDEFGVNHTYNFQTNAQGYYSGHIYAGVYNGSAVCNGYQSVDEPVQGNPINMVYNETTSPVDYIMDENFDPVCAVIAQYYPDSLDPQSPYVKVYWGCGLPGSEIIEDFETGDFSMFDWQIDASYPWSITTTDPYEGTYCMKSGGAGVASVVSNMTVTVEIPADGIMSFFGKISCENNWDYGYFYIDGVQKGSYTGAGTWGERIFDITAGEHTFQWSYTKDSSVNSNDDCFYVDYITFYKQPEPALPGMTYDFENSTMQGWTSVDADGDGYGWYVASEIMSTGYGHNGSNDCVLSQSYNNSVGVLYPDNYLVSPQVALGGVIRFYACAQDASYAAEHFGVAVSTTNTQPGSFTTIQEWTMSAKSVGEPAGKPVKGSRSGRAQGNWYEYTVDLSAYSGMGYVAIRHFNCSDMFYLDVDDITIGEPGAKNFADNTRSLDHYRVYRTNCYNDGPYTTENTMLLASVWAPDTVYIDVEWADLAPGVYKWGVGTVYSNNRGEQFESPISWSEPVNVNNKGNRDLTVDFEGGMPAGWNVIDANNDGYTWCLTSAIPTTWTYYSGVSLDWYHGGSNAICSGSYINGLGAVTPDEYLVSPQVTLGAGSSISFWVAATDASYPADHFGVFVSDNGTSNWTSVQEWTLAAKKSGLMGGVGSRDGNGLRLGTWYNYTVDLSAYAGQKYIAFRHFNCYDQYIMCLDDITIVTSGGGGVNPPTPGQGGTQLVDFENGQLPAGWTNDANYPWVVATPAYAGYNGTYCMMSGNSGISSSTSAMEATVTFVQNGSISFLGGCWGEGTSTIWDKCQFFIDDNEQFTYGALQSWDTYTFDVTAGTHTFRWSYTKDSSVNPTGDAFFVDDITFNGVAGGASGGLQLERESEIVWSNCLDKDMWLDGVTVTVLLNSADSPEGTTVDFTNLNEYEQQNYPVAQLTLDETGFYAFESFRRGDYAIKVQHEGFETVLDTVSIWENTDLRYVLIEILYGVENVYVSRTGWAMWDDSHNNPGGNTPGGGGGQGATSFTEGFENGLNGWNVLTVLADGGSWIHSDDNLGGYDYTTHAHGGTGFAMCYSFVDYVGSYNTDSYLYTPQKYSIVNGSTLTFFADNANDSYPENFSVCVATADNPTAADFITVWSGGAKGNGEKANVRHDANRYDNWRSHSIDLSAYAGQDVYIAFHDVNYDMYEIWIDDVELTAGAKNGEEMRHFEYYKLLCTSIDGVPIYNHNTVHPFCQLSTDEPFNAPLVEGEHYLLKIAAVYSTGISAWSEPVEWQYEPCDHWGPVDEVAATTITGGNHIEWVFEHGFNPYGGDTPGPGPQPGTGDWYYYDNGMNEDAIGTGGGNFWWGVMFPAGSYTGNMVTKVSAYDYMAMSGTVTIYQGGAAAPGTPVGETNVTFTGSEDFVEFEFAAPVNIDPTQNVWVVFYNASGATYPAAVCNNTGDANGRWVSLDGAAWEDLAGYGLDYTFMVRAYIASGAKGEVKEIKVNAPMAQNNGTLAISGQGARTKTVVENVNIAMMNENTIEFNIADIANFDARVYFLHNLINDSRFSVINAEQNGMFLVSANSNIELKDSFVDFAETTLKNFARMDKYQAADYANEFKGTLPMSFTNSMMMDIYAKSRENNLCSLADPFCTDNGMYEFPAGVNAGSGETGPDYDCLYTTPNPAWYYMRIGNPGDIDIYMYSTPAVDIDFCCWGPFDDPTTPCPNGLTEDKVVSCSYSAQPTEHCMIPANAQTGEYYILVITNYSNQTCNINFSKVSGSGDTDCGILPPVDIIGFLITMDGEYLAFAGPTDRDYLHEGEFGEHEYCVRPIYPGEMTLPSNNFGWSMGCPVCASNNGQVTCEPGAPIHGEAMPATDQVKVWWGEQNPGPGGCEGDEFTVDFESGMPAGWTTIDADGDGYNWNLGSATMGAGYGHNGSADMIFSQSYDNNYGALTPDNWLVTPAVTLCENSTFSFYACAQDNAWASEHFGVAVSEDGGNSFTMVQEWTMTAKGERYDGPRGMRDQGNWYQYTVDLGAYAGEGRKVAIRHFNCTDWFYIDVDDIQLSVGSKGLRAEIESYNVYRSTQNANYTLISNVPAVAGQTYYEYIDTPATAGSYYYQVTAVYAECESDPAPAYDNPTVDYVVVGVDAVSENGNMAIYPNPTKGNVTIEANGMRHITVVSTLGQVVFDADVKGDSYIMNMSQYTAGMYTVRVVTENGVSVNRITVVR